MIGTAVVPPQIAADSRHSAVSSPTPVECLHVLKALQIRVQFIAYDVQRDVTWIGR